MIILMMMILLTTVPTGTSFVTLDKQDDNTST